MPWSKPPPPLGLPAPFPLSPISLLSHHSICRAPETQAQPRLVRALGPPRRALSRPASPVSCAPKRPRPAPHASGRPRACRPCRDDPAPPRDARVPQAAPSVPDCTRVRPLTTATPTGPACHDRTASRPKPRDPSAPASDRFFYARD
jgi:hypothetical protein